MTIKAKIVLANLAVFGILLSGLAYFVYNRTLHSDMTAIDLRLESCAARIITEFEDEWEEEEDPEWDDILDITAEGLQDVRMSLRTIDGLLLFSNDSISPAPEDVRGVILAGESMRETVNNGGQKRRKAIFPVAVDGEVRFALTLMTSITETDARLDRLAMILFGSVAVALLIASIAVYLVTRVSFRPMSHMVRTAEQISADKLDRRIDLPTQDDEVSRIGTALNDMMDRIEAAFRSQRQFVADASHELRSPLTVIIGELEAIQMRLEQESLKESLQAALGEMDRLTRLVDQLLTLTRIDAGKPVLAKRLVRFDEVLVDCVRLMRREALAKKIEMNLHIEKAIEMNADPVKLKSIVLNLLENAVRYSGNGGTVNVTLQEGSGETAELEVSDTGPGIVPEDRIRVFDRFYRAAGARASSDGSGLGLAITKTLVELHDGRIRIEDGPMGGALFRVELPIFPPHSND